MTQVKPSTPRSRRRAGAAAAEALAGREPSAAAEPIPAAEPPAGPESGGTPAARPRTKTRSAPPRPRKLDQMVAMLSGRLGASLSQLVELTGWQPHSVRAALSGLRKQGYHIEGSKEGSTVTLYRITGRPGEAPSTGKAPPAAEGPASTSEATPQEANEATPRAAGELITGEATAGDAQPGGTP